MFWEEGVHENVCGTCGKCKKRVKLWHRWGSISDADVTGVVVRWDALEEALADPPRGMPCLRSSACLRRGGCVLPAQ